LFEGGTFDGDAGSRVAAMIRTAATLGALAALAMLLGAAAPEPVTIGVTMIDYKFEPDHLTLQHDVHYRLHLENHGKDTHEFTAPVFFATAKIDNPGALNRERSEVVVQPGQTKDVFLTPGKPGTYDLRCSDHDWNGMVGGITVQ
jgi:plastocyanin